MNADRARVTTTAERRLPGRVARPDDHTSLYVLLANREESAYVTGAMLLSDGRVTLSV
jgi:NAD(P)-dependent dehydrogenase (short-subunit alcohol dehydrogenase family)